MSISYLMPVII